MKDGQRVLTEAWGNEAAGSPVTTDTPFLIGSLSKPLTALAVLQLVRDGAVGLDVPVETYLPGFRYSSPHGGPITVDHLLRQTSGISGQDSLDVTDRDYPAEGGISAAVRHLSGVQLESRPGDRYEYASANYLLLGAVIESVTDQSFADVMQERVYAPLGMTNTFAGHAEAIAAGYTAGYQSWFGHPVKSSSFYDHAGAPYGYMISTANDLAAFLTFMQDGGEVLGGREFELLRSVPDSARSYGYGWRHDADEGIFFHGGATPHSRAEMYYDPVQGTSGVLLTNKYHTLEDQQVSQILDGIRGLTQNIAPDALPKQKHPVQWIMTASVFLGTLLLALNVYRMLRKTAGRRIPRFTGALVLAVTAVALVPLLTYATGTPWHSIRLFAPDIAVLSGCITALLTANSLVLLYRALRTGERGAPDTRPHPVGGAPTQSR